MINATHFGYGLSPLYQAQNLVANNSNDPFILRIKQVIDRHPFFSAGALPANQVLDPDHFFSAAVLMANQILDQIEAYLNQGGKPTLLIPELRIGNSHVRNISCFELVFRIYHCDFKDFFVSWDNAGVPINERFNAMILRCLAEIDQICEDVHLTVEEITVLIECVQASDPYLSDAKKTGNRILNLMDKLLARNGNPLFIILNVKVGNERTDKLTLLELMYLLWKHPYGLELEVEKWKNEDETIDNRFKGMINRCLQIIEQMLSANLVRDEDFLSLIRCVIEFSDDNEMLSEDTGGKFLYLMGYFVLRKANPNLAFLKIQIEGNIYTNVACFQVMYLLWKSPRVAWKESYEREFQRLLEIMLSDRRIDLTMRFSERSLSVHHFVNSQNIEFYRRQHGTNGEKTYSNGMYEPDARVIDQLHGHSLERMTVAHSAAMLNDYVMLGRFLDREPRLLEITCCMTRGKASMRGYSRYGIQSPQSSLPDIHFLEENDQISGRLVLAKNPLAVGMPQHIEAIRIAQVTLLHLAARAGHEGVLACLRSRHPNLAATDSLNQIPQNYLRVSVAEGFVPFDSRSQGMFKALDLTVRYNPSFALPEVNKLERHEGYDLLYDTSRKVAIFVRQLLGKDSFGEAKRTHHKWIENFLIPELNRAKDADFKYSGFDRGHLAPTEDSTGSDKKMAAAFKLENAVPQNPSLNRGAWSRLEEHVRHLVHTNDLVEVFTGPLFLPTIQGQYRVITHGLIGRGDVNVPTHFFKAIFKHNRGTSVEVYILPNQELPGGRKFSDYRCDDNLNLIQQ